MNVFKKFVFPGLDILNPVNLDLHRHHRPQQCLGIAVCFGCTVKSPTDKTLGFFPLDTFEFLTGYEYNRCTVTYGGIFEHYNVLA